MQPEQVQHARTKFIPVGELIQGTITEVRVNQEPSFHCTIKILPKDPSLIIAEGRYSSHEISLGKLKRNLVHLKFSIRDVVDIIAGVESLEGRECIFRVDKSGWVSWISRLIPKPKPPEPVLPSTSASAPAVTIISPYIEVFLDREPGVRSIYKMATAEGVIGWAVGPTARETTHPHGWVFNLKTKEEAIEVLKNRKFPLDK